MREIIAFFRKELITEWRQKYALNGILLYLISTIFVCYMSFKVSAGAMNPSAWNALFWIIILFTGINAVAKSFLQEPPGRIIYFHTIISGAMLILSKIFYNALLMIILSLIGYLFYSVVLGNYVNNPGLFVVNILLVSLALSTTLTMVSSIASRASQSATLMAILGFPIVIPILLLAIKVSQIAITGSEMGAAQAELLTLIAINLIVGAVSYILFPYLWRT